MIPKIIHYVWLGGVMPETYQNYIDGWKKLMPDYEFMRWSADNFDFSQCKYATEAYEHKKYSFIADYIRVAVLEEYGGIYLDTDVEVIKPFDDLLENEFFLGFENDANVGTAVLGSIPHHALLKTMLDLYHTKSFLKRGKPDLTTNTMYFTLFLLSDFGMIIRPFVQDLTDKEGNKVKVFSTDYFAPLNFNTKKEERTANTYSVHRYANSWSSKSLKLGQSMANGLRKIVGKRIFAALSRAAIKIYLRQVRYSLKKKNKQKS